LLSHLRRLEAVLKIRFPLLMRSIATMACIVPAIAAQAVLLKPATYSPGASSRSGMTSAKRAEFGRTHPSREAWQVANWVVRSGDNHGAAFVIVDKTQARAYVFDPRGRLRGAAPVLLGLAKGDDTVPGIGDKKLADIKPEERTTPAGRFVAEAGRNAHGDDIVWVDYDAAVSMHRVLTTNPAEHRLQRLATPTPKDNRISYGCINVPVAFFDKVLNPTVNAGETIIYVLPETRPASVVFGFRDRGDPRRPLLRQAGKSEPVLQLGQLDGA